MGLKKFITEKIFLFLQLAILVFFASCSSEDLESIPQPGIRVENTILVYIPWSDVSDTDSGLCSYFLTNIQDMKNTVVNQGGFGNKRLMMFISMKVNKGALINVQCKSGSCIDDTVVIYNNKLAGLKLDSVGWITTLLKRVKQEVPAKYYPMIVGCHGMGWIPIKPNTHLNRPVASPLGLSRNAGKPEPPTRWSDDDAYQTNILEFDKGMEDSGIGKLQYILFDDYNMTDVEVAYELCNAAHHITGSPTEVMAYGMPYKLLWNELLKVNPDYHSICTNFIDFYSNYKYGDTPCPYDTVSVIDRSQVEGMLNVMKEIDAPGPLTTVMESDIQSMDGYIPSMFYNTGDYARRLTQNEPQLLMRFNQQLNLLVLEKGSTTSYYTAIHGHSRDVIPIQTYSGITISNPSTNLSVTSSLGRSRYYQATH